MKRRWTEKDDAYLEFNWGALSPSVIAKELGRTHSAVYQKARDRGLGPAHRGTMTIGEFAEYSGYSVSKIKHALSAMGRNIQHAWRSTPGGGRGKSRYTTIDIELQEELLSFLLSQPTCRIYDDAPGSPRTTRGKWGVGRKPPVCVVCGTADHPHYARGKCVKCYERLRAAERKKNQRDPQPAGVLAPGREGGGDAPNEPVPA